MVRTSARVHPSWTGKPHSRSIDAVLQHVLCRREDPEVQIAELSKEAAQGAVMAAQEVLEELSKLGRANMADYMRVGPDGARSAAGLS
jgi:hypothetical protein